MAQTRGHFLAQMAGFLLAHAIEFIERFVKAARDDGFEAFDFPFDRCGGRADNSGQAQDGGQVGFGLDAEFLTQRIDGFQVRGCDIVIHTNGSGTCEFVMQSEIEMAAAHAFAENLADARLERLEAFGNAQMQIQEAMIHGADGDAQAPAAFDGARLRIARHGLQASGLRRSGIHGDRL